MNILEKDIEELVYNNIDNIDLMRDKGFYTFENKYYRQPNLGSYGIPDIVGVSVIPYDNKFRHFSFTVYELKKEAINVSTLLQASRYIKGISHFFNSINNGNTNYISEYRMVLIGKVIDMSSDFVFLIDNIPNLTIYTYELSFIHGLKFRDHSGYKMTNPNPVDFSDYVEDFTLGRWHKKTLITTS